MLDKGKPDIVYALMSNPHSKGNQHTIREVEIREIETHVFLEGRWS
jgi:hypothetical protein